VTTLFFETFEEDELRKNGLSKDNKSQQPQILIALMVSKILPNSAFTSVISTICVQFWNTDLADDAGLR